jgi:hypothetical protein
MPDRSWIEPIVERVVSQVLESHATQLRDEIVRRVIEEIAARPDDSSVASASSGTADLARAVSEIHVGTSQKEILRALLDATSRCAARAALFVVKGGHATGWQARGFTNGEAIKDFGLDSGNAAVIRAINERIASATPVAEFDRHFFETFGRPAGNEGYVLPLILKDKVAALVYADGGEEQTLDPGSLEVLVLATSSWLEVNALRRQAQKDPGTPPSDGPAAPAHPPGSPYSDPFAGHAPAYAMAAAASASDTIASATIADTSSATEAIAHPTMGAPSAPVSEMHASAAVAPVSDPLPVGQVSVEASPEMPPASTVSAEDQELHRKAQRFARLLVDEIKLYNQAKVAEGRKKKDLYDRLKEAIEKSRATYLKRYGNTVAASGNYFQHEVVRSLAEDDISVMGGNFHL